MARPMQSRSVLATATSRPTVGSGPSGTTGDRGTMAVFLAKFRFDFPKPRMRAIGRPRYGKLNPCRNQVMKSSAAVARTMPAEVTDGDAAAFKGARGGRAMRLLLVLKEIYCGDLK